VLLETTDHALDTLRLRDDGPFDAVVDRQDRDRDGHREQGEQHRLPRVFRRLRRHRGRVISHEATS